jgi:hypothetical protein
LEILSGTEAGAILVVTFPKRNFIPMVVNDRAKRSQQVRISSNKKSRSEAGLNLSAPSRDVINIDTGRDFAGSAGAFGGYSDD